MYTSFRKYLCIMPLAVLMLLAGKAYPQERWTLEKCIVHALENNLRVRQMEQDVEIAGNSLTESRLAYIPSLNASMGHNMSWGRSVNLNDLEIVENMLSQSSSLNLSASLPLFEGFRRQNTVRSNVKQLQIAQAGIEALKDDIAIAVAKGYLQVLLAKEIEATAERSCLAAAEQVKRTEALVEAGEQPYSSLLEVKSQLANENVQLTTARNSSSTALLELAHLLGMARPEGFDVEVPATLENMIAPTADMDIDAIVHKAAQVLPSVGKAQLVHEQNSILLKIQKGAALPTLSVSAGYGTYYSDSQDAAFFTQFNNNRNPSVGLSLSIPIFNNWRNSTAVKNARANVQKSSIGVEMAIQELEKQIRLAFNEVLGSYEKLKAAQASKDAAAEAFSHTSEKFNLGMLNGTDYTTAKNNLLKAESEYLQCKYQYIFQQKIMDYYKLVPLTL
jgi:outer membrane protein